MYVLMYMISGSISVWQQNITRGSLTQHLLLPIHRVLCQVFMIHRALLVHVWHIPEAFFEGILETYLIGSCWLFFCIVARRRANAAAALDAEPFTVANTCGKFMEPFETLLSMIKTMTSVA